MGLTNLGTFEVRSVHAFAAAMPSRFFRLGITSRQLLQLLTEQIGPNVALGDYELWRDGPTSNPAYTVRPVPESELAHVLEASAEAEAWVEHKLKEFQHRDSSNPELGWVWNGDENQAAECFFCGRRIKHNYAESSDAPAIGWTCVVNVAPHEHVHALYCWQEDCLDWAQQTGADDAKKHLVWREGDGGKSYVEVIGPVGPAGKTAATTLSRR